MKKKQLQKVVKGLFGKEGQIDGAAAKQIAQDVLSDGLLSRTEKRYIRGLLRYERLDQNAQTVLQGVLTGGS